MGNVTVMPGFRSDRPRPDPSPEIIEMLEWALQQAREGQLIGLGLVKVSRDPVMFAQEYHTEPNSSHSLAAGVMSLMHSIGAALNDA